MRGDLQQQRGLADARVAAQQRHGARHDAASEHPVELVLAAREPLDAAGSVPPALASVAAGRRRRSGRARTRALRCAARANSTRRNAGHWPCHLRVSPPQALQTNTGLVRAIYALEVSTRLGCAAMRAFE